MSAQRCALVLVAGAMAITLAACGGGGSTPTAGSAPSTPRAANRGPAAPPGVFGTAAAVNPTSIEVQNQSSQVTVNFTASTTFTQTLPAAQSDVTVGACVSVISPSGGARATALTARTVTIDQPTSSGTCAAPGGFGAGGGGRDANPSRQPRPSGTNGPGGGANFGRAFGSVTAVTATGFTVHGVARGANPAIDTVVTVTSSTTYTKTASATSAALAVGDCIAALGPADDTGAVTAKSIGISKPGPNGCNAGFGGRRGGNGSGNGGGNG